MKRREFVNKILTSLTALGILTVSVPTMAGNRGAKKGICFHAGTAEVRAEDGSWHIVVMPDPRVTKSPERIKLQFEVASDEGFENILRREAFFALKKNSYIVRVHYHPPMDQTKLFYRFVAVELMSDSARGVHSPESPASIPRQLSSRA